MPINKPSGEYNSVTVLRSFAAARPDGRWAIVLETQELGAIAFEVNEQAIYTLRKSLDAIERLKRQIPGNA